MVGGLKQELWKPVVLELRAPVLHDATCRLGSWHSREYEHLLSAFLSIHQHDAAK